MGVYPPLYLYFLRPCCEGAPCCAYPDCGGPKCHGHCSSGHGLGLFRHRGGDCCSDGGCAASAPGNPEAVPAPAAPAAPAPKVTLSSAKKVG
jgi:hypothetical protein